MKLFWLGIALLCFILTDKSSAIKKIACEHRRLQLSCAARYYIDVQHANYGRRNHHTCRGAQWWRVPCIARHSLTKVKKACQGKQQCSLYASNSVYGDPCRGSNKYLEVTYRCVRRKPRNVACENHRLNLRCPAGKRLHIYSAIYGRDTDYCPGVNMHKRKCSSKTSLTVVRRACQGKQSCSLHASNRIYGDPCRGVYKYLKVDYRCVVRKPSNVACEHQTLSLRCSRGKVLKIRSANYGRTTSSYCTGANSHVRNCKASSSLSKVRAACDNKPSCSLRALNGLFGDPCRGVYKYLVVDAKCITRSPPTTTTTTTRPTTTTRRSTITTTTPATTTTTPRTTTTAPTTTTTTPATTTTTPATTTTTTTTQPPPGSPMHKTSCPGQIMHLNCPSGTKVKISDGNYGRLSKSICPDATSGSTDTCTSKTSKAHIISLCNGEQSCLIPPVSKLFGDPCPGVSKYIEVDYQCVAYTMHRHTACEGSVARIQCATGKGIKVLSANYGRLSTAICHGANYINTNTCREPTTKLKVAKFCDNRNSCEVGANSAVFGDPCKSIYKYLRVIYACV